jgi:hypothetical protein
MKVEEEFPFFLYTFIFQVPCLMMDVRIVRQALLSGVSSRVLPGGSRNAISEILYCKSDGGQSAVIKI